MNRILFICAAHALDDDRVTRKEAVSLADSGYDVIVCARKRLDYTNDRVKLVDIETLHEVVPGGDACYNGISHSKRFSYLSRLKECYIMTKPDLVVAHEFETACLAWWIKKRFGTPYVFDAHEGYEETVPLALPAIVRFVARPVVRWVLKMLVRNSNGVTAASGGIYAYRYAKELGKPSALLYNAPIDRYFPYREEECDPITIVHEGNLTRDRGAFEMLEALAIIRKTHRFRFLVLGTIMDEVKERFMARIKELGLEDLVDIRGRLPWTEFGKIEAAGQIGLCCFQNNYNCRIGMPNKLFDYMSCGLAVVGLKDSEMSKVLLAEKCGLAVDTTKPEEIARAILQLLEDPAMRRRMARNGRKAMDERYGWNRMEKEMARFYNAVIKEGAL